MAIASRSVGHQLVERGVITLGQLSWAEAQGVDRPGGVAGVLLAAGAVTESQVVAAVAERMGVPFMDLDDWRPPAGPAGRLQADVARRARAVPISEDGAGLIVAMSDPTAEELVAWVAAKAGCPVRAIAAVPAAIDRALDRLYPASDARPAPVGEAGSPRPPERSGVGARPASELDGLLAEVVRLGGSDLHLSAGRPPGVRVHGEIRALEGHGVPTPGRLGDLILGVLTPSSASGSRTSWSSTRATRRRAPAGSASTCSSSKAPLAPCCAPSPWRSPPSTRWGYRRPWPASPTCTGASSW